MLKKRDWNRIQELEIKYLITVKVYSDADKLRNYVRNERGIFPL
jgi:hypothetical protein